MSDELKLAVKEKKLTIGTERTIKSLKLGKTKTVFLASNCKSDVKEQVEHYAKISGAKVIQLDLPDKEIGLLCKKPFNVSVLSY
ncbi:MAG: ribosomal L7Ae/L30e/S12e/Gadd45 family protein [Nanoarchaeota archaeon]|nr:ribosomal L7Ae/L30e/S12e/Gadd45 family protein [Nanoarchaeota archaeon]MBU4241957.1 ribosomal L7Ae/L30e/S12e/Gadd45 family protein [Nanoarchaeota archaeon]MBU4352335.1 ribosomal L7Ae/L30e/S12e/Gadd45 family protein [Nanoarchaeota archaeon]